MAPNHACFKFENMHKRVHEILNLSWKRLFILLWNHVFRLFWGYFLSTGQDFRAISFHIIGLIMLSKGSKWHQNLPVSSLKICINVFMKYPIYLENGYLFCFEITFLGDFEDISFLLVKISEPYLFI